MEALLLVIPVLVILIWGIAVYNRMVRLRNHIGESWSDIDVELKRRYDLVPNLVATVKGFAKHERETLERVVELRNRAAANNGSAAEQAVDETALMIGVGKIFALSEGYPELKSDEHFLALQQELALTEDRVAASRRFYNGNVRDLRSLCESFPTSILASMCRIAAPSFFELDDAAERVVTRVHIWNRPNPEA